MTDDDDTPVIPRTLTPASRGKTVREALAVALEGLSGDRFEWAIVEPKALKEYLADWIKKYALARGVIVEDVDVDDEIRALVNALRRGQSP